MRRVATSQESVVLFESPRRLVSLLEELAAACGPDRRVAVARELTKVHEEIRRGTLPELVEYYSEHSPRGEVSVVVEAAPGLGNEADLGAEAIRLAGDLLRGGMKPSAAAREITSRLNLARNDAYRIVQDLADTTTDE